MAEYERTQSFTFPPVSRETCSGLQRLLSSPGGRLVEFAHLDSARFTVDFLISTQLILVCATQMSFAGIPNWQCKIIERLWGARGGLEDKALGQDWWRAGSFAFPSHPLFGSRPWSISTPAFWIPPVGALCPEELCSWVSVLFRCGSHTAGPSHWAVWWWEVRSVRWEIVCLPQQTTRETRQKNVYVK